MAKHPHFKIPNDKEGNKGPPVAAEKAPVLSPVPRKEELVHALRHTRASQVPGTGEAVVEVHASMSPLESAKVLWEHNVLEAPVWDENAQKYVGIFDMRDLLSTVLLEHGRKEANEPPYNTSWFLDNLHTSYLAARNPFVPDYHQDTPLLDLCKALCRKETRLITLIDPGTKRCVRILSKSCIVKFLSEHVALPRVTLQEADFPYKKPVIQAPDNVSAQQVFSLMDQHRLSGIAIIDSATRKLVGNTSATDIKAAVCLGSKDQSENVDMKMDILSYLAQVRQKCPVDRYPSAHVHETSTVAHAVHLLAKTGFHRVFVVDDQMRPIGVVSVTDVVQYVVRCVQEKETQYEQAVNRKASF